MRQILELIYMTLISLFTQKYNDNEPARLYKKTEHKKRNWNLDYSSIMIIVFVIIILLISVYLIYRTGALDSTQYYYRLNKTA